MTDPTRDEVTVVNVHRWSARPGQLAQLLARAQSGRVIGDPEGLPADPEHLVGLSDPGYWAADVRALGDALADLAGKPQLGATAEERAAGAIAPGTERLTLTVEEAAATLGISRAERQRDVLSPLALFPQLGGDARNIARSKSC